MSFSFDFGTSGLNINERNLDRMLNSPQGEVGRYLKARGRLIVAAARRQVGVDTGALRASIHMLHYRSGPGQYIWIGSNNNIALAHHDGTRPHRITAKDHGFLRFHAGGRVIYSHSVNHPGTRPNRYLSDNLILARA